MNGSIAPDSALAFDTKKTFRARGVSKKTSPRQFDLRLMAANCVAFCGDLRLRMDDNSAARSKNAAAAAVHQIIPLRNSWCQKVGEDEPHHHGNGVVVWVNVGRVKAQGCLWVTNRRSLEQFA